MQDATGPAGAGSSAGRWQTDEGREWRRGCRHVEPEVTEVKDDWRGGDDSPGSLGVASSLTPREKQIEDNLARPPMIAGGSSRDDVRPADTPADDGDFLTSGGKSRLMEASHGNHDPLCPPYGLTGEGRWVVCRTEAGCEAGDTLPASATLRVLGNRGVAKVRPGAVVYVEWVHHFAPVPQVMTMVTVSQVPGNWPKTPANARREGEKMGGDWEQGAAEAEEPTRDAGGWITEDEWLDSGETVPTRAEPRYLESFRFDSPRGRDPEDLREVANGPAGDADTGGPWHQAVAHFSSPPLAGVCSVCLQPADVPFRSCRRCGDKPSFHHGGCCPKYRGERLCEVCHMVCGQPFPRCGFCGACPSFHHGRCCPMRGVGSASGHFPNRGGGEQWPRGKKKKKDVKAVTGDATVAGYVATPKSGGKTPKGGKSTGRGLPPAGPG